MPVVDGYSFPHLTKRLNIAGRHITAHLTELLRRRGHGLSATADLETVRQLKEAACFVALDYPKEAQARSLYLYVGMGLLVCVRNAISCPSTDGMKSVRPFCWRCLKASPRNGRKSILDGANCQALPRCQLGMCYGFVLPQVNPFSEFMMACKTNHALSRAAGPRDYIPGPDVHTARWPYDSGRAGAICGTGSAI